MSIKLRGRSLEHWQDECLYTERKTMGDVYSGRSCWENLGDESVKMDAENRTEGEEIDWRRREC